MLRSITRNSVTKTTFASTFRPTTLSVRTMADKRVEDISQAAGEAKDTNPKVHIYRNRLDCRAVPFSGRPCLTSTPRTPPSSPPAVPSASSSTPTAQLARSARP